MSSLNHFSKKVVVSAISSLSLVILVLIYLMDVRLLKEYLVPRSINFPFENFDNETGTGTGCYIVPNYVHFLRFGNGEVTFPEAVCLLAAFKHQRPEKIFIHTNVRLKGKNWQRVLSTPGFTDVLDFQRADPPMYIFGQEINPRWRRFHGGDVTRIRILQEYGGIFLDNDSYLVRSLDNFRRFEMTIGWKPGKTLENQVIVAHRDARFLKLWLESYKDNYKPELWYYNAGELPTKAILEKSPHLVHREENLFGVYGVVRKVFMTKWPEWRSYYAVHLMVRHQSLLNNISSVATYPVKFTEENVHNYPIAFRDMAYDVYPFPSRSVKGKPIKREERRRDVPSNKNATGM